MPAKNSKCLPRCTAVAAVAIIGAYASDLGRAATLELAQLSEPSTPGSGDLKADSPLSQEQKLRLKSALASVNVASAPPTPMAPVIGATVPANLPLHRLPEGAREAAPGYRGYRFSVVGGKFCIVDPATNVIVDVLD